MGNKGYKALVLESCFCFRPEPGVWGRVGGQHCGTSAGCLSRLPLTGPSQSSGWPNNQAFMNVPSKRPSQGCHRDLRRLEVALIPFQSNRMCNLVTCGREEETLCLFPSPSSKSNGEALPSCHPVLQGK